MITYKKEINKNTNNNGTVTSINAVLTKCIEIFEKQSDKDNKTIILISDGLLNQISDTTYDKLIENHITVHVISFGITEANEKLNSLANRTGGLHYDLLSEADLNKVAEQIAGLSKVDTKDFDEDGLFDIFERNGIKLAGGSVLIKTHPFNPDTDGDELTDGAELYNGIYLEKRPYYIGMSANVYDILCNSYLFHLYSNPLEADTDNDNDGIIDKYDRNPRKYDTGSDLIPDGKDTVFSVLNKDLNQTVTISAYKVPVYTYPGRQNAEKTPLDRGNVLKVTAVVVFNGEYWLKYENYNKLCQYLY